MTEKNILKDQKIPQFYCKYEQNINLKKSEKVKISSLVLLVLKEKSAHSFYLI